MPFDILWEGQPVPASGTPPPAPNTYAITAAPAPPTPGAALPPEYIQWQGDGVDAGGPNARIINLVSDPAVWNVSRGTGEQSNVVTVERLYVAPPPPPSDPFWDDVILLAHMDSDFSDSSTYNVTPTVAGATINTSDTKFGAGAGQAVGGGLGFRVTYEGAHLDLNLYPDFTIEVWHKRVGDTGQLFVVGMNHTDPTSTYAWFLAKALGGPGPYAIRWTGFDGALSQAAIDQDPLVTPAYDNGDPYFHVAVTRQGSTFRLFLDGLLQASATYAGLFYAPTLPELPGVQLFYQSIGIPVTSADVLLDDLRITAACRYTADFTPPTAPFPDA